MDASSAAIGLGLALIPGMTKLRCYDYVNSPYAPVRDLMKGDAVGIFQRATRAAHTRAEVISANLHTSLGPIVVGTDIEIRVLDISEGVSVRDAPITRIKLAWSAVHGAALFPSMQATLSIYPLTATETQLELDGDYTPPLGAIGAAIDLAAGHSVADATVLRFVQEVAEHLRHHPGMTVTAR